MSTLKSINVQHPSATTTNIVNDSSGNVTVGNNLTVTGTSTLTGATTLTGAATMTGGINGNVTATGTVAMASSFKRNRIINGNMVVAQRGTGSTTVTASGYYSCDRWYTASAQSSKYSVAQNAGSVTPPAGFTNYIGITSLSAYTVTSTDFFYLAQAIEGYNVADLGFGAVGASSVTISFWVRSSLTGTFGGCLNNYAGSRSYPFTYTISAANTWEQKTVTISGDTTGTWNTTNSGGFFVVFGLGIGSTYSNTAGAWASGNYPGATGATSVVGTNGATFYITGVQLEVGTKATPYEMQIYSDQLAQCQRYYEVCSGISGTGYNATSCAVGSMYLFKATKRASPTLAITTTPDYYNSSGFSVNLPTVNGFRHYVVSTTTGNTVYGDSAQGVVTASAEL